METETIKARPVKRFLKTVASLLPEILLFIGIQCLVISFIFCLAAAVFNGVKNETLVTENDYLKNQIEWYQAQLEPCEEVLRTW